MITMITVMTHMDSDGIISLAFLLKHLSLIKVRAFFTSPVQLRDTICRSLNKKTNPGELYIFDLAAEHNAIYAAAIYDSVLWIDHHEWAPNVELPHVKIIIDSHAKSAASVVARHLGIDSPLVNLADEIDTNNIKSPEAEKIRLAVGALRFRFTGVELQKVLKKFAYELAEKELDALKEYEDYMNEYKLWLDLLRKNAKEKTKIFNVNGLKVAVFEATESVPVYAISNELDDDIDILVVLVYYANGPKSQTKLEFRTRTDVNVLKIAKFYGGGGHVKASGATVYDIITVPEVLKTIELIYS